MWKDPVTSHQKLFYVENVILIDNSLSYIGTQENTPHSEETPEVMKWGKCRWATISSARDKDF